MQPSKKTKTDLDDFLAKIENGVFQKDELMQIARELGKSQRRIFYDESQERSGDYHNVLNFAEADFQKPTVNPVVVSFLCALCGFDSSPSQENEKAFNLMLEHLYYVQNRRFVGKTCFARNLMVYCSTRSKQSVDILASDGPYGAYATVTHWLRQQGKHRLTAPEGDIITYFDNNQVVGKTHHITLGNKAPSSTITTTIHIATHGPSIQHDSSLCPSKWLSNFNMDDAQQQKLKTLQEEAEMLLGYVSQLHHKYSLYKHKNKRPKGFDGVSTYFMPTLCMFMPTGLALATIKNASE